VNEQLQAALEELQNLAYVMSHELQEPLQTIKSYQNLLAVRYRGRLGADADEFIAKCATASDTTQKMVDDLWEYARVGQASAFPIGKVDTTRALSKAISTVYPRMIETDAELDHGSLPAVLANENLMTTLFTRLLDNSIKYARPGVSPRIRISANEVGSLWEFEVRDNGKGIDPMIGKDIFKLFFRGERRVGQEGSGMGLPIARKIIEYIGGTISFESEPGQGTSFRFSVPKA
jgi:light-regulated signal transduction histidine kinase (bacteriophytochrome)